MIKLKKKPKTLAIMLVLALGVLFAFQMNPVLANTPEIIDIEYYTSGNNTFVRITVLHSASAASSHYVETVRWDIDGTFEEQTLEPQPDDPDDFFVEYNLGEVTGTPTVRARAIDTTGTFSIWSERVMIPEFPTLSLLLILAIVSIAVLLFRSRL
jgi:hypothetical protein